MPFSDNDPSIPELKQQAIDWLVRLRSDDLSDGEMYAFADWLSQDHAHSEAFATAEKLFNDMVGAAKSPASSAETQTEFSEPRKKTFANPQLAHRKRYTRWMAVPLALAAAWSAANSSLTAIKVDLMASATTDATSVASFAVGGPLGGSSLSRFDMC